jgi:hypothetical protein
MLRPPPFPNDLLNAADNFLDGVDGGLDTATSNERKPKRVLCFAAFFLLVLALIYGVSSLLSFLLDLSQNEELIAQLLRAISHDPASSDRKNAFISNST